MNQDDDKVDQVKTESVEDLELTNQQAGETKAGAASGSGTLQTYTEIKLTETFISGYGH